MLTCNLSKAVTALFDNNLMSWLFRLQEGVLAESRKYFASVFLKEIY
jgi:hypothetical protein